MTRVRRHLERRRIEILVPGVLLLLLANTVGIWVAHLAGGL